MGSDFLSIDPLDVIVTDRFASYLSKGIRFGQLYGDHCRNI